MYRVIACDLDETLLNDQRKVGVEDLEAIAQAEKLGVKFVPATGRGFLSVEKTLKELNTDGKEHEYVISYNGGAITENKDHRLLHYEGLPFELANTLYQLGTKYNVCVHAYTPDTVYINHLSDWPQEIAYLDGRMEVTEVDQPDLEFLRGQEIVKVLFMNTDADYLHQIEDELKPWTENIDVSYSSNRYIEFNAKGVSKGSGLLKLLDILQIPVEESIAIGDNINDLPMIRDAGLGVGVANSVEAIKPDCDYVTEATNNEGAVAEVIRKFILEPAQSAAAD